MMHRIDRQGDHRKAGANDASYRTVSIAKEIIAKARGE